MNVLFLMSDEHRPDITGYEGDNVIHTPNLDWLAETGVQFRHAYTPSPICVPARQCMMSGQLPATSGCTRFRHDLPPFSMTFAKRFAQYAYKTVCAGKLHHHGPDQMQGWTTRLCGDMDISASFIEGLDEDLAVGFKPEPGTGKWTNQKEIEQAGIGFGPYQQFDRRVIEHTNDFLRQNFLAPWYDRPGRHQPLMLKVSLLQPHYPFFTDRGRFEYYLNRVPVYHNQPRSDHPVLKCSQNMDFVKVSERDARRATAAYYGMIDCIDAHYGSVLETLRNVGEDLEDWLIIYTSDHGEMLGEHGIWEKTRFFESSVRVPLLIRPPKNLREQWNCEGRKVDENVNLCDLFATLCQLCDVPLPREQDTVNGAGLDSRSLVPLIRGKSANWNNESVSQLHDHVMIMHDNLKYQYYGPENPEVLFDHEKDPGECENFANRPEYGEAIKYFRERRKQLSRKK